MQSSYYSSAYTYFLVLQISMSVYSLTVAVMIWALAVQILHVWTLLVVFSVDADRVSPWWVENVWVRTWNSGRTALFQKQNRNHAVKENQQSEANKNTATLVNAPGTVVINCWSSVVRALVSQANGPRHKWVLAFHFSQSCFMLLNIYWFTEALNHQALRILMFCPTSS